MASRFLAGKLSCKPQLILVTNPMKLAGYQVYITLTLTLTSIMLFCDIYHEIDFHFIPLCFWVYLDTKFKKVHSKLCLSDTNLFVNLLN